MIMTETVTTIHVVNLLWYADALGVTVNTYWPL